VVRSLFAKGVGRDAGDHLPRRQLEAGTVRGS
jgi:hypothetical protein